MRGPAGKSFAFQSTEAVKRVFFFPKLERKLDSFPSISWLVHLAWSTCLGNCSSTWDSLRTVLEPSRNITWAEKKAIKSSLARCFLLWPDAHKSRLLTIPEHRRGMRAHVPKEFEPFNSLVLSTSRNESDPRMQETIHSSLVTVTGHCPEGVALSSTWDSAMPSAWHMCLFAWHN